MLQWKDKRGRTIVVVERISRDPLYMAMYFATPDGKRLRRVRGIKKSTDRTRLEMKLDENFERTKEMKGDKMAKKKPEKKKSKEDVFSFPTKSRCPRCGSTDTVAYSTVGDKQYRKCKRVICRKTYTVLGTKI